VAVSVILVGQLNRKNEALADHPASVETRAQIAALGRAD
jgi:hypothetical protein